tara:strand:+ start:1562 stop:2494 length:933 start_codon:yes stop_codon:yes gene_type:complete
MAILTNEEQAYYATGGDHGSYQFISLTEIIDSFRATYVGPGKICEKVMDQDITFFAIRGIQELSYDTLKSVLDWEITVPPSLVMVMPVNYINYVKLSWSDTAGIEHVIYPTSKTSNPKKIEEAIQNFGGFATDGTNEDLDGTTDSDGNDTSTTWGNFKANSPNENTSSDYDYSDNIYDANLGQRHGIDPQHAQVNGSFFIDENSGKFHFSSNLSGKTLVLKYISDGLVTNAVDSGLDLNNTKIHKFAEEAIYKYMAYGLLSARTDVSPNTLQMLKKERFAEQRKAKLRLSNIKIEELAQTMRGKSKWIKH